jgi:hypothetical protein
MSSIDLIANPVSARDIRRIVANASNLQIADPSLPGPGRRVQARH